jgi:hypothetical protein
VSLFRRRGGRRVPPVAIADAVELWARNRGRHATLVWSDTCNHWQVRITYRDADARLRSEEPYEKVDLLRSGRIRKPDGSFMPGLVGMDLEQEGVQGVLDKLNEGSVGTGRFASHDEAVRYAADHNRGIREKVRSDAHEDNRHFARIEKRRFTGTPLVRGDDLADTPSAEPQER